jgi:alkylation response protein AidB-like acyl-CoA dehydrogenase
MDTNLTSDQELLRDASARFIQTNCPLTKVRELADSETGIESDYLRQAGELGWFAMLVPEEYGGGNVSGSGLRDAAVVADQRGRYLQPGPFVTTNVVAEALVRGGSKEQRTKVLPSIAAGDVMASWVLADASGSWDVAQSLRCQTKEQHFVLHGTGLLVQDAVLADLLLVTSNSEIGITQFLIPKTTPGVHIESMNSLDITRRFDRVRFDEVEVQAEALIGQPGASAELVDRQLQVAIALTLAEMLGAMDRDFETVLDYAKARTAFGRPIGSFQAVKHLLADTSLLLEASKAVAGSVVNAVGDSRADASEIASIGKAFVSDSAIDLAQNCWQVFGGIGYTWEHDQHLYMRRLTTDAMLYGEATWHRERICTIYNL